MVGGNFIELIICSKKIIICFCNRTIDSGHGMGPTSSSHWIEQQNGDTHVTCISFSDWKKIGSRLCRFQLSVNIFFLL